MKTFREAERIQALTDKAGSLLRVEQLAEVAVGNRTLPIYGFVIGSDEPKAPTYGVFGGVHGLEKIGTHLATYFLESLVARLDWDHELRGQLEHCRFVSIPLLNPGGMLQRRRSNPNGVDLMRNAPVQSETLGIPMLKGQRLSRFLPWFRGKAHDEMEIESRSLTEFVHKHMFAASAAVALDIHSGFGVRDRVWYPYAKTKEPIADLDTVLKIKGLLDKTYPFHVYKVEAQSANYTTHGDLWDYLYDLHRGQKSGNLFLPWTLELGSWLWVRKNPKQAFSVLGPFNPTQPHRYRRIMRRHTVLLEFLFRVTRNFSALKEKP